MKASLKKLAYIVIIVAALVGFLKIKKANRNDLTTTIAITQGADHAAFDATYRGIIDILKENGYVDGINYNLVFESAQGNPVIANQIARKFSELKPKLIVALGTVSAQAIKAATQKSNIPVVFTTVTDPLSSKLVSSLDKPEANITGLSNWIEMTPQLQRFRKILPSLKTLGFIYNPGEDNSVVLLKTIEEESAKLGIKIISAPATRTSEVNQATQSIVKKVDAIFISNDNTALAAFETIVKVANESKIPVFVSDTDMVERGAIAAVGPNQYELGRQTGRMILQILNGKKPGELAVGFPAKTEFHLNLKAINAIGLKVLEKNFEEADRVYPSKN